MINPPHAHAPDTYADRQSTEAQKRRKHTHARTHAQTPREFSFVGVGRFVVVGVAFVVVVGANVLEVVVAGAVVLGVVVTPSQRARGLM